MSIISKIGDGEGKNGFAGVRSTKEYGAGLKVYSYEGDRLNNTGRYFTNEIYGSEMNQNAAVSGTPDQVHNGIDTVLWTGSQVAGGGSWVFNSGAQAHTGSLSVDATGSNNNSTAQFAKGSNLTIANYVSLTGWIYLTGWSTGGTRKDVEIFGWDTGTAAAVSSVLNIGDYINTALFNTWQKFSIPFADFAFSAVTLDAIRIRTIDIGGGPPPNYYLDDIQFEEDGSPIVYSIGPSNGDYWELRGLSYTMARAYAGTVTGGTMPSIPYDGFLGLGTLDTGIVIRRVQAGVVQLSTAFRNTIDIIASFSHNTMVSGSDGTNTWFRIDVQFPYPVRLSGKEKDKLELVISDDLSSLLFFKANATFGEHKVIK